MRSNLTLDAVVCTKDRPSELKACLASLASQTLQPSRVVVVSAGGPPVDPDAAGHVPVEFVRTQTGLPVQRNIGLARGGSDLIGFFDDDVILEPEYLEVATAWFSNHENCAGVTGHITNDPVRKAASRTFRALFSLADDDGSLRVSGDVMYLRHPVMASRVDVVSGSNMVFRRSAVEGLFFDESLEGYAYMEDVEFSLQASRRGDLWAVPGARLVHVRSMTARIAKRQYVEQVFANGAYIFGKHGHEFGFRWLAFIRRMLGRTLAYFALGVSGRSLDPMLGTISGLMRVPSMVRAGRARAGE